jgi:hypothetical protein
LYLCIDCPVETHDMLLTDYVKQEPTTALLLRLLSTQAGLRIRTH